MKRWLAVMVLVSGACASAVADRCDSDLDDADDDASAVGDPPELDLQLGDLAAIAPSPGCVAPETGTAHPIYDAYFTHFNDAYNTGKRI